MKENSTPKEVYFRGSNISIEIYFCLLHLSSENLEKKKMSWSDVMSFLFSFEVDFCVFCF